MHDEGDRTTRGWEHGTRIYSSFTVPPMKLLMAVIPTTLVFATSFAAKADRWLAHLDPSVKFERHMLPRSERDHWVSGLMNRYRLVTNVNQAPPTPITAMMGITCSHNATVSQYTKLPGPHAI